MAAVKSSGFIQRIKKTNHPFMYVYGVYANGLKLYASTLLLLTASRVAIIAIVAVIVTVIDELYIFQVSKMPHELNSFRIYLFAQYSSTKRYENKNTRK